MNILEKINHTLNPNEGYIEKDLSSYQAILIEIKKEHEQIADYSNPQLQTFSKELKNQINAGETPDNLLPKAFALVKETCLRLLKISPYDVQLIAGIAMHERKLIEMQTGEGKTLAAVFPAFLNAILGNRIHILTFNDYLAKRDAEWMGAIYKFLGLSVSHVGSEMPIVQKQKAYQSDIVYTTAKGVGFDYLRSFIAFKKEELIVPAFDFAIVDEADAILIDEARHPLVLAGNTLASELDFYQIAEIVGALEPEKDYEFDDQSRNVFLTEPGMGKLENAFAIENLHEPIHFELNAAINLALQAKTLLEKDIHYLVKNGSIQLVDEFTGRVVADRKWRNGLQTAVEAKEGLKIQKEGTVLNSITLQHLLQKYQSMAGMTATASAAAEEFAEVYQLPTFIIPPNQVSQRIDHPDLIFANKEAKNQALLLEVKKVHDTGRPILIGTLTVRESEKLALDLKNAGIDCQVLNAKNDELEANIILEAGKLNAVTISTNMAGRGTDIKLGGADELEKQEVMDLGGLYVIGTNRHESKRVDQQLRGRAGRQGENGSSRFFISMEDDLMEKYQLKEIIPKKYRNLKGSKPIEEKRLKTFINITQGIIEKQLYDLRKMLCLYATLIEKQRGIMQEERQDILLEPDFFKDHFLSKCPPLTIEEEDDLYQNLKSTALFYYDKYWAEHLDYLSQIKDGIFIVRLGGQKPLREFQRQSEEVFLVMRKALQETIQSKLMEIIKNPDLDFSTLGIQRPSSTWTYITSDNPFNDQLSIMLLDNSNIGLTADPISATFLFVHALIKRWRKD